MRILIALTYYRPHYSGLTIYAERVARELAARGHKVTVLTSRYDKKLPAQEVSDGVEIVRPSVWFRISKGVIMPSMPYWAWKLMREADIVQLHVPQLDAAPITLLGRILNIPVLLTYHCDLRLPPGFVHTIANQASNLANRIAANSATVIVHNTSDYAEHSPFLKHYLDKLHPIYPPVKMNSVDGDDLRAFREKIDIQPDQRIIGMAARLATEKGVEYLAKAMVEILKEFPKARVLFVGPYQNVLGEEDYEQRLAPLIAQLGKHWTYLGILSSVEMSAFFHECELTVLPSINSTESFGMVQVESMSCGTPVVASDLPGVRIPVELSSMGRVVPPEDPVSLAEAIMAILNHPEQYQGHPEVIVPPSTPQEVTAEYERLFRDLVKQRNDPKHE